MFTATTDTAVSDAAFTEAALDDATMLDRAVVVDVFTEAVRDETARNERAVMTWTSRAAAAVEGPSQTTGLPTASEPIGAPYAPPVRSTPYWRPIS